MIVSESFVIADWTDPGSHPTRLIAPLHLHHSDDEAWIVLAGRLGFHVRTARLTSGGDSTVAPRHRRQAVAPSSLAHAGVSRESAAAAATSSSAINGTWLVSPPATDELNCAQWPMITAVRGGAVSGPPAHAAL